MFIVTRGRSAEVIASRRGGEAISEIATAPLGPRDALFSTSLVIRGRPEEPQQEPERCGKPHSAAETSEQMLRERHEATVWLRRPVLYEPPHPDARGTEQQSGQCPLVPVEQQHRGSSAETQYRGDRQYTGGRMSSPARHRGIDGLWLMFRRGRVRPVQSVLPCWAPRPPRYAGRSTVTVARRQDGGQSGPLGRKTSYAMVGNSVVRTPADVVTRTQA